MAKKIYVYDTGEYPGKKLTLAEKSSRLYHFTSFDSFVKIWLSHKLKFSPIDVMNDIQEKRIDCASSSLDSAVMLLAYGDIRKQYKQISLTMDYDSFFRGCMCTSMWGHYGNKSNGICIELDPTKISFEDGMLRGPIRYSKVLHHYMPIPTRIKKKSDLEKYVLKNKTRIFFTKQASWKEENEYRIVSAKHDYLDISEAITAVYLTSNKSTECFLTEELVNGKVPVKYLTYVSAADNLSLPMLKDTRKTREKEEADLKSPDNVLPKIKEAAEKKLESLE